MKFKHVMLVFSLIICVLFSISIVAASDLNESGVAVVDENQVIEQSNDDLIAESDNGTFTDLQAKIILARDGDTINLDNDYYYDSKLNITTGILIDKDITINGNGHILDGMSKSRIFIINYGGVLKQNKVTLNNITFKDGNAKIYGGAILNFADLEVNNCNFINNNAGTAGGAINSLGALDLKNSYFNKNSAEDAGAVFSLTLKNGYYFYKSYFVGKNATEDPNLLFTIVMQNALEPGKDTISKCLFTNNVATGTGGGAVYAFSHIDISSCVFNFNKAGEKGGAVFGCKDLNIMNSKFYKNYASMYGGAVYFKCHEQTGKYVNGTWVSSIKFYSNLIEKSVFGNNVAGERGGAIYGFKVAASDNIHCAKAVKCTFGDNIAPKGKDIFGGIVKSCVYINTKIAIKTAVVKKSAKRLVLTAALKKGSTPLKYKQVIFKFNGKTYKAKTNSKGIAKCLIKKNVLNKLKVGKKVKYQVGYGKFVAKKMAIVKK